MSDFGHMTSSLDVTVFILQMRTKKNFRECCIDKKHYTACKSPAYNLDVTSYYLSLSDTHTQLLIRDVINFFFLFFPPDSLNKYNVLIIEHTQQNKLSLPLSWFLIFTTKHEAS